MSIVAYPRPGARLGGRPKGSGKIKKPEEKSTHPAKLSPLLIEILESERRHNESYSDTIIRLLTVKTHARAKAEKKVSALEERLSELISPIHAPEILIN